MHQMRGEAEPEPRQVRDLQRLAGSGATLGDMTQRIRAFVAEARRIGRCAEAEGIHD